MDIKKQRWNFISMNDRILLLDQLGIINRVAFQLSQLEWDDLESQIQKQIMELK